MFRALVLVIGLLLALAPAAADARPALSKQRAHAKAVQVMADFGPMYEPGGTPAIHVAPAPKCRRTLRTRIYCEVSVKTSRDACRIEIRLELRGGRVVWHYPELIFDSKCYVEPVSPVVITD